MSGVAAPRGPSGAAPPPPSWLGTTSLPIDEIDAGTTLYRVHRSRLGPVFFGPGPGNPPVYRFDSAGGRFGVLYVGLSFAGAFVETLLRNPQRQLVSRNEIEARSMTELTCARPLRLARLHGDGLQRLGTDNAISTGPYEPCGLWSDALWNHRDLPNGIAYSSRHDPGQRCLAIFQRADLSFHPALSQPLAGMMPRLHELLAAYDKSVE